MEHGGLVSNAEWFRYVSGSYAELYDILIKAQPDFYSKDYSFSTVSGVSDYSTASDFYGDLGVDYKEQDGYYLELDYASGIERNNYDYLNTTDRSVAYHFMYNAASSSPILRLLPAPRGGDVYRHRYTVRPTDITNSTTTIDGISGWEEYIVIDAAIKARIKEETPTGDLERQLARMRQRLDEMVDSRTLADTGRIIDTRRAGQFFWDPFTTRYSKP